MVEIEPEEPECLERIVAAAEVQVKAVHTLVVPERVERNYIPAAAPIVPVRNPTAHHLEFAMLDRCNQPFVTTISRWSGRR